jgi:hypothetical protein
VTTANDYLNKLRGLLGVTETPRGSNRTSIGAEFGWNGVAWCAETVCVALARAGIKWLHTASTDEMEALARKGYHGLKWHAGSASPQPGWLCIWDYKHDGTANHVSTVESARADGKLVTIGGNEQDTVQRAVRSRKDLRGFISIPFDSPAATPAPTAPKPAPAPVPHGKLPTLRKGAGMPPAAPNNFVALAQAVMATKAGQKDSRGRPLPADGRFGDDTFRAVVNVQRFFGLEVDGVIGPQVWKLLTELNR